MIRQPNEGSLLAVNTERSNENRKSIQLHPPGRALTSDWSADSFIMVVYERFFLKIQSKCTTKNNTAQATIITIYGSVRSECSSDSVNRENLNWCFTLVSMTFFVTLYFRRRQPTRGRCRCYLIQRSLTTRNKTLSNTSGNKLHFVKKRWQHQQVGNRICLKEMTVLT